MLVSAVGTMDRSFEHTLAQIAVIKTGEDGLLGGVHYHDGIGSLTSTAVGILHTLGDISLAESRQFLFLVDPDHSIVGSGLQGIAPLLLQIGNTEVNLLHTGHLVLRQQRALTNEVLIGLLQKLLILTLQHIVLTVVDLFDTLKKLVVERDLVVKLGQQRHHLLLNLTDFICLVGFCECEEHPAHAVEQTAAFLKGDNRVLERGGVLTLDDGLDVLTLLGDSCIKSRHIVGHLNLTEIGCAKGQLAFHQQRVLTLCLLTGSKRHHHSRCHS